MSNRIINGIKYWGQLVLLPVYWLSFVVPRNKHIWLFGSTFGRRFADNPRYLYLYANQHKEEIMADAGRRKLKPIWISHSKDVIKLLTDNGYEAYYNHSLKGIWYCLRGKIYIFDNYSKDISFWLSGGAVKFNLWHGVGNKKINYDNKFDVVRHPKTLWDRFQYFPRRLSDEKPSHYILATSPMMCDIFARAFQVERTHVIEAGYPRNDVLLGENIRNVYTKAEEHALEKIKKYKEKGYKIALYMPTFRKSETEFKQIMDLEKFNTFLKDANIIFVTKLHPKSAVKELFQKIDYANIYNLDSDIDSYIILGESDLLVTDYSSIYSDYILLDKPVVAFQYDYELYEKNTREGYFEFDEYMPEVRATDMQSLMAGMAQVLEADTRRELRKNSREKLFSSNEGTACMILCESIRELVQGH